MSIVQQTIIQLHCFHQDLKNVPITLLVLSSYPWCIVNTWWDTDYWALLFGFTDKQIPVPDQIKTIQTIEPGNRCPHMCKGQTQMFSVNVMNFHIWLNSKKVTLLLFSAFSLCNLANKFLCHFSRWNNAMLGFMGWNGIQVHFPFSSRKTSTVCFSKFSCQVILHRQ